MVLNSLQIETNLDIFSSHQFFYNTNFFIITEIGLDWIVEDCGWSVKNLRLDWS